MKIYDNGCIAVKNISFGVQPGQIFGLLGPNGAGKSTTFGIMSCLFPNTIGNIELNHLDPKVEQNQQKIFQEIGVCHQYDLLWEVMTVYEHLKFFSDIKGLHEIQSNEIISYIMKGLKLELYKNR